MAKVAQRTRAAGGPIVRVLIEHPEGLVDFLIGVLDGIFQLGDVRNLVDKGRVGFVTVAEHQCQLKVDYCKTTRLVSDTPGVADFGIVPVENSTEGSVNNTLDMFITSQLKICGEVELRIRQHLMGRMAGLEQIDKVYSHQQSLAQAAAAAASAAATGQCGASLQSKMDARPQTAHQGRWGPREKAVRTHCAMRVFSATPGGHTCAG